MRHGGEEEAKAKAARRVSFKVIMIVADHWPNESSWVVTNTEVGDVVAEANIDDLVPGEPVTFAECINNRAGCYEFTINGEISMLPF